jgi:spore coat polysaccharide biosynthesis predicted glycosyltransferase SpsG
MWGLGHLYRNIALAKEMLNKGYQCVALINECEVAKEMLKNNMIDFFIVGEYDSALETINIIKQIQSDKYVIFFDRLNSDNGYFNQFKAHNIITVSYDDDGEYYLNADVVINSRPTIKSISHKIYSGFQYQIIRKEVVKISEKKKLINKEVKKILVYFGGTDPNKLIRRFIEECSGMIRRNKDIMFLVISGADAYDEKLSKEINSINNVSYLKIVDDFYLEIYEADIALLSGGVTAYECAAIGTPMILIAQNEDQALTQALFKKKVNCVDLGLHEKVDFKEIEMIVEDLVLNYEKRVLMSTKEKQCMGCDGLKNICSILQEL